MKKLLSTLALSALMLVASSGFNANQPALAVGDKAPEISVSNDQNSFDLNDCKGGYVLLTFWSSSDAQSRIDCSTYSAWFDNRVTENIKHVALNFDSNSDLFSNIVRIDNFDAETQFNVKGLEAAQIRLDFGLNDGYGSVLISPDGHITSFNPSISDLSSLI